ncbi:MAG: DUF3871 family protein [Chitinophagaceae bacterium]
METLEIQPHNSNGVISFDEGQSIQEPSSVSTDKPFIQANTTEVSLQEIKDNHIIPVFIKDNEPLISHADFIETTLKVASDVYSGETILSPTVRVSHPVKGRIPEAKNKPANELEEWEKTIYFERMAFIIEVPSISDVIGGNTLSLTIGGVKSYGMDNLYSRKSDQHFKIFVGFNNRVCLNLKIWSDGYMGDLKVTTIGQLSACIRSLLEQHNAVFQLNQMKMLCDYSLSESQFAHLIGKARMYQHLPKDVQRDIPQLMFGDQQISSVVRDYYRDNSFCRDEQGNINLWRLYNLFTEANKSSYIDNFIDRSVNSYHFIEKIKWTLEEKGSNWYLS